MVLQRWKKKTYYDLNAALKLFKKKKEREKTNIVISKTWSFREGSAVVPEDFFVVSL